MSPASKSGSSTERCEAVSRASKATTCDLRPELLELLGGGLGRVGIAHGQHDPSGPGPHQAAHDGQPDLGGASQHQHRLG